MDTRQQFISKSPLLITGCYRSGTTVLEKILNQHPQVAIASQPFPLLYTLIKERFLADQQLDRRYPLGHLFLETCYRDEDFYEFIDCYVLTDKDITEFFDLMDDYHKGLWTPEVRDARSQVKGGTFWEVYHQLMFFLESIFLRRGLKYRGTKEVLIEEYASYFTKQGAAVIIVARDPRALIASLNFRMRNNLTGANRPILFSLRAWRKSIAIATALVRCRQSLLVRYEDFVTEPSQVLQRISDVLEISSFTEDIIEGEIFDQYGHPWRGNSSFDERKGISRESVNSWQKKIPRQVLEYIETICMPEMRLLGYKPSICKNFDPEIVSSFRDPFDEIHAKFPSDYSHDPLRVQHEIERIQKLLQIISPTEQRQWFINENAYLALRRAIGEET